jgi:hypothetical protein
MPTDDREKQFERALARHLPNASFDSSCPDAETLAAYQERTLSLEELARWKEHIAACARCQESLLLVEQSADVRAEEWQHQNVPLPLEETVQPKTMGARGARALQGAELLEAAPMAESAVPIRKATARPQWRWIAPVGALAAGVIVWVGMREIQTQRSHEMESVQVAKSQQAAPQPPPAPHLPLKREEPSTAKLDEEPGSEKTPAPPSPNPVVPRPMGPASSTRTSPSAAFEAAPPKQKDVGIPRAAGELQTLRRTPPVSDHFARSRDEQLPAPPPANAPTPAEVTAGAVGGTVQNGVAKEKKMELAPGASERVELKSATEPADTTATSALAPAELAKKGRKVANPALLPVAARGYIVAPDEKHVWRVGEAGKIERSTDSGKTWKLQKSGATTDLTAGFATSHEVCWVVGKGGTLLLTTDGGKHWKQISSPINEDLGGIHATDALHASIWDVWNRKSYETTDGGATWHRISNQ